MRKCNLSDLPALLSAIAGKMTLYLPVAGKNGGAAFTEWSEGVEYADVLRTDKSPKELFFPQSEDLAAFRVQGKSIEIKDIRRDTEDFVVFGVRACDAAAMDILDRVFLSEPRDSYYANRREHGIIITMACGRPDENCFCNTFGIDPRVPGGDISAWKTQDAVCFEANTERGAALLDSLSALTVEGGSEAVEEQKVTIEKIMKKLPLASLKADAFGGGKTMELFDNPAWDKLSESCLGCGTCTFVCPTCQCYDIRDINTTDGGVVRYRCWDSCMYSQFTRMAHGNNRNSQKERFRQRFMHKLVYFPENNDGVFSCVGCGRCLAKCPISMNIVKVMKTVGGDAK
ncbi:MAG: 4Fe-4S dicluster domain-containing protein [Clostridia bacterium]|nr:4Fe-4S dicluster domain-containing protein [Clostridia bacterium]